MSAVAVKTSAPDFPLPRVAAICGMLVDAVAPYIKATPYKKKAVAKEPRRKYLIEDSVPMAVRRR